MEASHYSVGTLNTTPASAGTISSVDDNLFFYNSAVAGPVSREFVLGSAARSIGSMTFGSNAGTTQIDRDAASAGGGNNTVLSVGAGGITVASGAGAVTFGSLVADRNQRVTVRALADYTVANNSANDLTFNRDFDSSGNDITRTVTVAGSGNGDTIFMQILSGATNRNIAMTINKTSGTGVVRFDGTNTYTGATTVTAGTLLINGSTVAGSAVNVAALGTLGGNGTVGGATTFTGAGVHAPGSAAATVGTQAFSSTLAYGTGTIFNWDINVDGASNTYDKVTATGAITGSAAVFKVVLDAGDSFTHAFWDTHKSWTDIFTGGSGSVTNLAALFGGGFEATGGLDSSGVVAGQGFFTLSTSANTLSWTAVPEPTPALAGLLLAAGLLRRRRVA
jgi:autotransporter-associated beta strand protein